MLQTAYPSIKSPALRYQIDTIMMSSSPQLKFLETIPQVVSFVRIPGPERHEAPTPPGKLLIEYAYHTSYKPLGKNPQCELVLTDVKTNQSFTIPLSIVLRPGSGAGGTMPVELPAKFTKGVYHMFIRVTDDAGKTLGEGQGPEITLPTADPSADASIAPCKTPEFSA